MTERRRVLIWGNTLYLASIEANLARTLVDADIHHIESGNLHDMAPAPDAIIVDTAGCDAGAALHCLIRLPGVPVIALAPLTHTLTVLCSWATPRARSRD